MIKLNILNTSEISISIKKNYRIIKLNQKPCLKSYIVMNTDLRKNNFEKEFF